MKKASPNRWRVENSWGDAPGKKGYYVMSDEWFDEYMYQIVVNEKNTCLILTSQSMIRSQSCLSHGIQWDHLHCNLSFGNK